MKDYKGFAKRRNLLKAFKGFDKRLRCRGFQYEVGKRADTWYTLRRGEIVEVAE